MLFEQSNGATEWVEGLKFMTNQSKLKIHISLTNGESINVEAVAVVSSINGITVHNDCEASVAPILVLASNEVKEVCVKILNCEVAIPFVASPALS